MNIKLIYLMNAFSGLRTLWWDGISSHEDSEKNWHWYLCRYNVNACKEKYETSEMSENVVLNLRSSNLRGMCSWCWMIYLFFFRKCVKKTFFQAIIFGEFEESCQKGCHGVGLNALGAIPATLSQLLAHCPQTLQKQWLRKWFFGNFSRKYLYRFGQRCLQIL